MAGIGRTAYSKGPFGPWTRFPVGATMERMNYMRWSILSVVAGFSLAAIAVFWEAFVGNFLAAVKSQRVRPETLGQLPGLGQWSAAVGSFVEHPRRDLR